MQGKLSILSFHLVSTDAENNRRKLDLVFQTQASLSYQVTTVV